MKKYAEETINVLLVEDDVVDIQNVDRSFKKINLPVQLNVVHDGLEALNKLYANNEKKGKKLMPQIIIMDINMPKMSGIDFLKELRRDPELDKTKVFILTTSNSTRDKCITSKLKVDGYILKPIETNELFNICMNLKKA